MTPMHGEEIAIALRSTVVAPRTAVELAKKLDGIRSLSHIFIPEVSQKGGFQSLEISSACLGVSKRLRIGSGVIRILEHDPDLLAARLLTLQALSDNRFVLGIGTGKPGGDPKKTIQSMLERLRATSNSFGKSAKGSDHLRMPETFIATLRRGIAKAVIGHSDGILLNFCPPEYARALIESVRRNTGRLPIVSCYLKLFYSRREDSAKRMLIQEFVNYNVNPSYHKMFELAGVADEIASASSVLSSNREKINLSEGLLRISLANPSKEELAGHINRFRDAGVDLPCLYPYFQGDEDESFMMGKVEEMATLK